MPDTETRTPNNIHHKVTILKNAVISPTVVSRSLIDKFIELLQTGTVVKPDNRKIITGLLERLWENHNNPIEITDGDKTTLQSLAKKLRKTEIFGQKYHIQIHSDNTGRKKYIQICQVAPK